MTYGCYLLTCVLMLLFLLTTDLESLMAELMMFIVLIYTELFIEKTKILHFFPMFI